MPVIKVWAANRNPVIAPHQMMGGFKHNPVNTATRRVIAPPQMRGGFNLAFSTLAFPHVIAPPQMRGGFKEDTALCPRQRVNRTPPLLTGKGFCRIEVKGHSKDIWSSFKRIQGRT